MGKHKNPQFCIRVKQELIDKIDILAELDGRTRNNMIERILIQYVEAHKEELKYKNN